MFAVGRGGSPSVCTRRRWRSRRCPWSSATTTTIFSGRFTDRNNTLWASWGHHRSHPRRVYFGRDAGYTKSFEQIGFDHGPFGVTLCRSAPTTPRGRTSYMNPEEAVRAHQDLNAAGSGLLMPTHWGTFRLAPHPWAEPPKGCSRPRRAPTSRLRSPFPASASTLPGRRACTRGGGCSGTRTGLFQCTT